MNLVQSKSSRVDKRSASTFLSWHGGCAALIHPTFFTENKFTPGADAHDDIGAFVDGMLTVR